LFEIVVWIDTYSRRPVQRDAPRLWLPLTAPFCHGYKEA
jgi:hypothetical protein